MDLPINLGKVKLAADTIINNVNVEITINVYVDTSCSSSFIQSIRALLDLSEPGVHVNYIDLARNRLYLGRQPNFAIIIAGEDSICARCYKALYMKNIATVILCVDPQPVLEAAGTDDLDLIKNNVLCPSAKTYSTFINENGQACIDFSIYNEDMESSIYEKFCGWLYEFSDRFHVSYAAKLPFMRPRISSALIHGASVQNGAVGGAKIFRGADMPIMTANQARMILELAAIYGYRLNEDRIVEIVGVVIYAFIMKYASKYVKDFSSLPDFAIDAVFGFAGTELLGIIAREYFSRGFAIDGLVDWVKSFFEKEE